MKRHRSSLFSAALFLIYVAAVITACSPREPKSETVAEEVKAEEAQAEKTDLLADTQWRLVEFKSMDDAQGTLRPDDPTRYVMLLRADGTVQMRLNCNRANGTWTSEPAEGDPASGTFGFGPLAATEAACPPPSMDGHVLKQAPYVRSYLLRDGKLYLALMADGGIYTWEPHDEKPFLTDPDPAIEQAVRDASPDYRPEIVGEDKARYLYGRADLDGDGKDEVLVYLLGSIFCGSGGCNMMLFTQGENGYRLVNNFPITRTPVIVSPNRTEGWSDLWRLEYGGGARPGYVRHAFDGTKYVERERTTTEHVPEGALHLSGDFTFQTGIPLEPRD